MADFPERLVQGYRVFRATRLPAERGRMKRLAEEGQRPEVMIVGCVDSRAAPETIFDAAPGELFVHRNVANLIPPYDPDGNFHGTSAAIEFGVIGLGVRHLVVMGHGRCGGVAAFLAEGERERFSASDFIGRWIALMAPAAELLADDPAETANRQQALEFASVKRSLDTLRTYPWIGARVADGRLVLHGAWFDISTGELRVLDPATGAFHVPD